MDGRVNENLNLTRAIGDLEYKRNADLKPEEQIITSFPDVVSKDLTADDEFFLMGCDGVWELLDTEDICKQIDDMMKEGKNPS